MSCKVWGLEVGRVEAASGAAIGPAGVGAEVSTSSRAAVGIASKGGLFGSAWVVVASVLIRSSLTAGNGFRRGLERRAGGRSRTHCTPAGPGADHWSGLQPRYPQRQSHVSRGGGSGLGSSPWRSGVGRSRGRCTGAALGWRARTSPPNSTVSIQVVSSICTMFSGLAASTPRVGAPSSRVRI